MSLVGAALSIPFLWCENLPISDFAILDQWGDVRFSSFGSLMSPLV